MIHARLYIHKLRRNVVIDELVIAIEDDFCTFAKSLFW